MGGAYSAGGENKVVSGRERPHLISNGLHHIRYYHHPPHLHPTLPQALGQEVGIGVLNVTFQDLVSDHCEGKGGRERKGGGRGEGEGRGRGRGEEGGREGGRGEREEEGGGRREEG